MSRIKGKNTKPEMLVRKFLHAHGFLYRLHVKDLPEKPDVVLPKYKTVIFVHGCFWHGHEGCKYYVVPKTKTEWWLNKINGNIASDDKVEIQLSENRRFRWLLKRKLLTINHLLLSNCWNKVIEPARISTQLINCPLFRDTYKGMQSYQGFSEDIDDTGDLS